MVTDVDVIAAPLEPTGDDFLELAVTRWDSAKAIASRVCDALRETTLGADALAGAIGVAIDAIADSIVSGVGRDDFATLLRDSAGRVTADLDRPASRLDVDPRVREVAYRLRILALVHAAAAAGRPHSDEAAALEAALRIRGALVDPLAERRANAEARRQAMREHPVLRRGQSPRQPAVVASGPGRDVRR